MKELTIEQKAKRYNEALEKARQLYAYPTTKPFISDLQDLFPELQEDEDERIRKALIDYFDDANKADENPLQSYGIHTDKAIAWLEKQGTFYTKKDVDDAYLKGVTDTKNEIEKQYEASYQIRKDIATFIFNYKGDIKDRAKWIDYLGIKVSFVEKQGEQKPAIIIPKFRVGDEIKTTNEAPLTITKITDSGYWSEDLFICSFENSTKWELVGKFIDKVEPKFNFKVGQYIVATGECVYLITKIDGFNVTLVDTNGDEYVFDASSLDDAHEWTIQDAKDGDVLINKNYMGEHPFIFKEIKPSNIKTNIPNPLTVLGYCGIGGAGFTKGNWWGDTANCIYYPATKEQRDLLFQKMKDAGYEWNAEKKELKKIEHKYTPKHKVGDTIYYNSFGEIKSMVVADVVIDTTDNPMYEDKEGNAVFEKDIIEQKPTWSEEDENRINRLIAYFEDKESFSAEDDIVYANWLKSLRPPKQWKPSEEQIATIEYIIRGYESTAIHLYAGAAKQLYSLLEQFKQL